MPKRYTGNYIVRWLDAEGKQKDKSYDSWTLAQKAARWLAKSGATNIDIAVVVK